MRMLKKYEGFFDFFKKRKRKTDVKEICEMYNIKNWSLVDGLVNVDGDVNLHDEELTDLPLKFGTVTGYFDCSYNNLTSLDVFLWDKGLTELLLIFKVCDIQLYSIHFHY